jgi:DNA-binding LytR/AlgR family response regulator
MLKCIAIDDEPLALRQLTSYISKIPYLDLVAKYNNALEAQQMLAGEKADLIFVDINMPDLNGMDFVRSLVAPPLVVFTTAYSEYAIDGYKVNAVDYLLKPFSLDDFRRAALRVKERYEHANTPLSLPTEPEPELTDENIFLKTEHKVVRVKIADIRYIEGMSEYLKVHIIDQPRPIIMLLAMKRMEERLPSNFLRIHRSYIVNMNHVQEVTKNRIVMDADTYLPIGDMYKEALNNYLADKYLGR